MDNEQGRLKRFETRVRWARAWRGAAIGACSAALAASVLAGLDAARLLFVELSTLVLVVGVGLLAGAAIGFAWKVRREAVADSIDRRAGLSNRIRTALSGPSGAFAEEQSEDAWGHLTGLKPKTVFPMRFGRWQTGALALMAVAASLFLLGNTSWFLSERQKAERAELQKAGPIVEKVARPKLEEPTADERALDAEMRRFAKMLERGRLDRPEALQKANELAQRADELARDRFEQAERSLETANQALEKMIGDELAKQGFENIDPAELMRDPADAASEMSELENRLQRLEQEMQKGGLSDSERAQLAAKQAQAREELNRLQLSAKARETFQKLFASKEFQEIMKMARELQKEAQAGQQGRQKLTAEQVKALQDRLEELAKQLEDPEKLKEFLDALREALKQSGEG